MLDEVHQPPADLVARAAVDAEGYARMYAASIADPDAFWGEHGRRLDWIRPHTRVKNSSFDHHNVSIKWFEAGKLNVSANCIDRRLATRADQTAIIWVSDDPNLSEHISYRQLHAEVSKFANVLLTMGVRKGDRVVIYLPMIPQAAYAMLACSRIGAIHSIVFAGFSADALRSRIEDFGRQARHHRRRGAARRPQDRAESQRRQGDRRPRRREAAGCEAHRRRGALGRRRRRLAARGDGDAGRPPEGRRGRRRRLPAFDQGPGHLRYVTLMTGKEHTEALRKELVQWVR